ncbi:hypothetical protein Vspart_04069 [Vibrio spartinae]|uniref:Uncharacterized protein n=1 Tax=Vibrio spartinae TaxID=1918945 RepID=A0ABX6R5J2_9VIBR|nr:hypothetical protein Vspart_04069 [Vibrio spartinae]
MINMRDISYSYLFISLDQVNLSRLPPFLLLSLNMKQQALSI